MSDGAGGMVLCKATSVLPPVIRAEAEVRINPAETAWSSSTRPARETLREYVTPSACSVPVANGVAVVTLLTRVVVPAETR